MFKRVLTAKEITTMKIIMEYSYAVHTQQPELFTYFNPEEIHILGHFTYSSFARENVRDIFEWAYRNYGEDIPQIFPTDGNIKNLSDEDRNTLVELVDECAEWLGIKLNNRPKVA